MRLAAFVPTYRRTANLLDTLRELFSQTRPPDRVLVLDNAASGQTEAAVGAFGDDRVQYHPMPENAGPAGAAALGLAHLRDGGFDWILWQDDDDPPRTPDTLERLVDLIEADGDPDLGAVAAVGARWDWLRGETRRLRDEELEGSREVDVAGGGQALLIRASVITDELLPDPRLFFGLEEFEFCLRLRAAGYRILVDGGLLCEYRQLAGRLGYRLRRRAGRWVPEAALWRRYYTTRNYVHMMLRTFGRSGLAWRETGKALARCAASWGRGPGYGWRFTRAQLAGVRDGFAGRLGRTVEPGGYPGRGGPG